MIKNKTIDEMRLDGGLLCLDFVNTVPDRFDGSNRDTLGNFNDLIYWAKKAEIIDKTAFAALERAAQTNDRKAKDFFSESISIRSLIHAIFKPVSLKQKVKSTDIDALNKLTSKYFQFLEVAHQKDKFEEKWNFPSDNFHTVTAPIVKSAYELLLSGKLSKVKECPNCGWLFLDTTKNGKRKWCSMKDCGSSVKALEWYYRQKK